MIILIIALVLLVIIPPAAIWKIRNEDRKARESIKAWAISKNIDLSEVEKREILKGPYLFRPNTFSVYRAVLKPEDLQMIAWILMNRHSKIHEYQIKKDGA